MYFASAFNSALKWSSLPRQSNRFVNIHYSLKSTSPFRQLVCFLLKRTNDAGLYLLKNWLVIFKTTSLHYRETRFCETFLPAVKSYAGSP